ncbi:MAG: AraC family transcriptional regulator [Alphaproteobacteria bacterium]|nr:AraC family transcriptional regulator [Alphaproteobacteria bacterium]
MSADVLSDVLQAVRLRGAVFYWVEATAPWIATAPRAEVVAATVMPGADHVMEFHVVAEGECWAGLADGQPEQVAPGDVIIFPQGDAHVFRSARDTPIPDSGPNPSGNSLPFVVKLGGRGTPNARFVCGFLGCDARPFNPLLQALPRMLRVPSKDGPLADLVRLAVKETAEPRPGGEALRARLAEMMFVEAVRRHLASLPASQGGWLGGLRDPHVGRVLSLLHARPSHPWTLDELARESGLSRTPLHERFSALVGQPPMQYLAQWRIQLAASQLAGGNEKVAAIALGVGYESEAAFNRAFKRLVGMPPAAWRRSRLEQRA